MMVMVHSIMMSHIAPSLAPSPRRRYVLAHAYLQLCLASAASSPGPRHAAAKRVLRYLKGSSFTYIVFSHHSEPIECTAFVDSTWGSDPDSLVFVTGHIVCLGILGATHSPFVGAAPMSWRSALQKSCRPVHMQGSIYCGGFCHSRNPFCPLAAH
jgi:hypothetical protein